MTDRERQIIAKVQGLLRLAADGGATEAEAALAAERAQEIMRKYAIDAALLAEESSHSILGVDRVPIEIWVREWRLVLAVAAAATVAGQVVYRSNRVRGSGEIQERIPGAIEFFVPEGTGDAVLTLFRFLEAQCARMSAVAAAEAGMMSDSARRRWRQAWLEGACARIAERLEEHREAEAQEASSERALVLVRDRVEVAMEEAFPDVRPGERPTAPRGRGYEQGWQDGGTIDLGSPVLRLATEVA